MLDEIKDRIWSYLGWETKEPELAAVDEQLDQNVQEPSFNPPNELPDFLPIDEVETRVELEIDPDLEAEGDLKIDQVLSHRLKPGFKPAPPEKPKLEIEVANVVQEQPSDVRLPIPNETQDETVVAAIPLESVHAPAVERPQPKTLERAPEPARPAVVRTLSYSGIPTSTRFENIRRAQLPSLKAHLSAKNLRIGDAVFIRIFKSEAKFELWMKPEGRPYQLAKTYDICTFSGQLGPKLQEGDRQSPEGFYRVTAGSLNPRSSYHLSFNLGFPNRLERDLGRTGSFLMVHGDCKSIGCYAMTDPMIEEIYTLVYEALGHGQKAIEVHAFPFRMTAGNLAQVRGNQWYSYWRNLKSGFDAFESTKIPPEIGVRNGTYNIQALAHLN